MAIQELEAPIEHFDAFGRKIGARDSTSSLMTVRS